MARAIWTGTLSFGLVSIPVRLVGATVPRDVRFHHFQAGTGRRLRYRRVAPGEEPAPPPSAPEPSGRPLGPLPSDDVAPTRAGEAEVPWEDVVKGFEIDRDRFVLLTPEELEALAPQPTKTIAIEDFVDLAEIDPVHFEKSYYVTPQRGAEKPYVLLVRAMEHAGKVAIGRLVLRTREHLAAIRPVGGALVLETLFYADEVRPLADVGLPPEGVEPTQRELEMAGRLIDFLATAWDPARYRDTYRERVLGLIEAKVAGQETIVAAPPPPTRIPDLMEALRESVRAARERRAARAEETGPA